MFKVLPGKPLIKLKAAGLLKCAYDLLLPPGIKGLKDYSSECV